MSLFYLFFLRGDSFEKVLDVIYQAVPLTCVIQTSLLLTSPPGDEGCKSGNEGIRDGKVSGCVSLGED